MLQSPAGAGQTRHEPGPAISVSTLFVALGHLHIEELAHVFTVVAGINGTKPNMLPSSCPYRGFI